MKVTLQISDDLYEKYAERAAGQATAEELLLAQLERFKEVSPMDRVIVVLSKERAGLEKILSGGTLRDGADLLQKVSSLASIEIGGVKVDFSPGELRNIKHFATKNRIPAQQAVEQVVHGMKEQFGLYVG
jgi:hypothetical protein